MISVIVPVRNGAQTLCRCVDSILYSTISDLEIILVENGSTDQTLEICQSYSKQYANIRTIVADTPGLSHARNLGMDAAHGAWIAFVDADDYISPFLYERFLQKARQDHNDLLLGDIVLGHETAFCFSPTLPENAWHSLSARTYCQRLFCIAQYSYSIVMNKLFSADLVRNLRFDETLRYTEDREFMFRVLHHAQSIAYLSVPVYYYYQGNAACISKSAPSEARMDQVRSLQISLAYSNSPEYTDYIYVCLLQTAAFRYRRAMECRLTTQAETLVPIMKDAARHVRKARYLDLKTKMRFLLEYDSPLLFHLVVKILGKG